jgi:anaerobic selenocysteine-containing dehydrogenase
VLVTGSSIDAPTASGAAAPVNDAYSLRLVAGRRMYDAGTMLQACPSSAGLAAGPTVRLNPVDFDKLGVDAGADVKVIAERGELIAPVAVDAGVPAGSAAIPANAPGLNANTVIDASAPFTDVRVERA